MRPRLLQQTLHPWLLAATCAATAIATLMAPLSTCTATPCYDIAFVLVVTGAAAALALGGGHTWFFQQLRPAARAQAQALQLLAWTALPAMAFTALVRAGLGPSPESTPGLLAVSISAVHVTGIAFFLLRSPLPARLLPLALVALAWWIPALIPPLAGLLDASPVLAPAMNQPETWKHLAPCGALFLAASLLSPPTGTLL